MDLASNLAKIAKLHEIAQVCFPDCEETRRFHEVLEELKQDFIAKDAASGQKNKDQSTLSGERGIQTQLVQCNRCNRLYRPGPPNQLESPPVVHGDCSAIEGVVDEASCPTTSSSSVSHSHHIMLVVMDEAHRAVLERCSESIECDLDYNLVCANLILTGVLNWKLHHIINARPTNRLKARALMAILPRRGPLAFQRFLAALDAADYVWLIEEINRALYAVYTDS